MSAFQFAMRCTVHDIRFGFDRPKDIDPHLMKCPVCAKEEIDNLRGQLGVVSSQRDALITAIDLAKIYQKFVP